MEIEQVAMEGKLKIPLMGNAPPRIKACGYTFALEPAVKIKKSINFQKFRQDGENRPGIRNQRNQFMTLQLDNLQGKIVQVIILCVDAEVDCLVKIHPNGLVGRDCHHGLYDKLYAINSSQESCHIEIPYIHIERVKTRKSNMQKSCQHMLDRTAFLPSPWRERFMAQCNETLWTNKIDTTKVRLAVIVTVQSSPGLLDKPLIDVSDVIKNGNQNTSLDIMKISTNSVPARTGTHVDIFTAESSLPIEPGKYKVYVTHQPKGDEQKLEYWISAEHWPSEDCILYKKVISYWVPPFEPALNLTTAVEATLNLVCPESKLHCTFPFFYVPSGADTMDLVGQDDYGILTDTDLDACPRSKKSRHALFEDDNITASFYGHVKIKPLMYQGEVSGHVTEGNEVQNAPGVKDYITDLHKQKPQYLKMQGREITDKLNNKMEDVFLDKSNDVINNSGWAASIVGENIQHGLLKREHQKMDISPSQSGIFNNQNKSLALPSLQDYFNDKSSTNCFTLKRTEPLSTDNEQVTPNCQESVSTTVSMPNCKYNYHDKIIEESSNGDKDVKRGFKLEHWSNQILCDQERKESCPGHQQNALSHYQTNLDQNVNNFQANTVIKESQIYSFDQSEQIPVNESADSFNTASFNQSEHLPSVNESVDSLLVEYTASLDLFELELAAESFWNELQK